jgi:peptide/nickel transport system substrate-binding protein
MGKGLALLGTAGILGFALAGTLTAASAAPTAASTAKTGGTVVVALAPDSPPNWFVPIVSAAAYTEINAQIEFLMYRPLIYLNSKSQVDYSRSLASKIAVSNNGTTYTITLGHKYKWSNGTPVTAQDVVFTWDIIKDATSPHAPWTYGASGSGGVPTDWKSVVAKGKNTVVVTLTKPVNPDWFIHNGLSQLSPIPESVWNRYPTNPQKELSFIESVANSPTNPVYDVVDGPFKFQSWQADNYWSLVPNPHYGGHKASISKLTFEYETSSAEEFTALKEGDVSVGYLPPSMYADRGALTQDRLTSSYLFGMNYMVPNFSPKAPNGIGTVFSNLYVRQAMQMGINQQGIIKTLYHGSGIATDGPIPSKPPTIYIDSALNKAPYPFNPTAGKKLLEKHGWHEVNGVMTKGGKKLSFTILYASGSITETSMLELIKSDWAREGIQVSLEALPINEVLAEDSQSDANKWQMIYWGAGWTYQLDYYPTGGNLFKTGAGENGGGYNSPTLDTLINDPYAPGTAAQIQSRMDAYQEFMAKNLPVLWMPWFPMGYARVIGYSVTADNVHGPVSTFNPVTDFLYANYWTVS